jgi:hypothetical protein
VIYERLNLIRYRKKSIPKKTYKLLETLQDPGSSSNSEIETPVGEPANKAADVQGEENLDGQIVPYWVPSLDICLVDMPAMFGRNSIPSAILQHLRFNDDGHYFPVVYHNGVVLLYLNLFIPALIFDFTSDFFLTSKSLIEVNTSSGTFRFLAVVLYFTYTACSGSFSGYFTVADVLYEVAHAIADGAAVEVLTNSCSVIRLAE